MSYTKFFLFGIIGIVLLGSCSPKTLQFQLQPEGNSTFTYRMSSNVENAITVMGSEQASTVEQATDYEYKIQKVNSDQTVDIIATLKKVRLEQAAAMASMVYDSEKPEANNPAEMMGQMDKLIGTAFKIKLNAAGEVLFVKGEEEIFKGLFKGMPNGEMMEKQMETQFGSNNVASGLDYLTGFYPKQAVKVGDSWMKETTKKGTMPMIAKTTYTLKERKDGIATIEFSSALSNDPNAEAMEMMGMSIRYDLGGTQTGTIKVDEKTGWANSTSISQDIGGSMIMEGGAMGEMKAVMKIGGKHTYEKI